MTLAVRELKRRKSLLALAWLAVTFGLNACTVQLVEPEIEAVAEKITSIPSITSVSAPGLLEGTTYGSGTSLEIVVRFSSKVDVELSGGVPTLSLNIAQAGSEIGGSAVTTRNATYAGGSGTDSLIFTYVIEPMDRSEIASVPGDLNYTSTLALALNGAIIQGVDSGENASLTLPELDSQSSLASIHARVEAIPMVWTFPSSKTCGITAEKILKCWGSGYGSSPVEQNSGVKYRYTAGTYHITVEGRLQDSSFNEIDPGVRYETVSTNSFEGNQCGITTTGALRCWGTNLNGQVGDGSQIEVTQPKTIDEGNTYLSVSMAPTHVLAIRANGDVYCWGYNIGGSCGSVGYDYNSSQFPQINSPEPIYDGSSQLVTGYSFVATPRYVSGTSDYGNCAIRTADQALLCWGEWVMGGDYVTPIHRDPTSQYRWVSFGPGHGYHYCGVTIQGLLRCGDVGSPPDNIIDASEAYYSVSGAGAAGHSCAVTSGGALKCWGANHLGQVGVGTAGAPVVAPALITGF